MEDYKQLLADFDRWTGKGNLIQANQTAAKLFRLIFADREAVSVSTERAGKTFLAENETLWHAGNDGAGTGLDADALAGFVTATGTYAMSNPGLTLTAADLETIANQIEWMRAERAASGQTPTAEIGSTIVVPDAVSPEEALAAATAAAVEEKAKPAPKKKTIPKKGSE